MKNNKYYKNIACFLIAAIAVTYTMQAQEVENSPAALEQMKNERLWSQSSNAGGILLDNPIKYSAFDVSYNSFEGNFHRPQQGEKGNNIKFSAEGGVYVSKMYVWGIFEYNKENIKDANFNSSIIDPYRGMPYYTADMNISNWDNQFYKMGFKAALPLGNSLMIGIDGLYNVAQGAKQRDPRTLNEFYSLDLKPGIVFLISPEQRLGLNFEYTNQKENSYPSLVNTGDYQFYYELYGLGTAIENIGTGKTVNYVGDKVGGNLQYNYHSNAINFLLSGGYNYKVEEAQFSFTNPEKYGTIRDKVWNAKLLFDIKGDKLAHHLRAVYTTSNIDGIQYIKQNTANQGWQILHSNVRSTYGTDIMSADYSLSANKGAEYKWKVGVGVQYVKKDDVYLMPYSFKNAENLLFGLNGKIMAYSSDKMSRRLMIGAEAGYNSNLSGAYSYAGNHADYKIVTELEPNDLNYLITDYLYFGGDVTYSQQIKDSIKSSMYIKGAVNYHSADSKIFDNRTFLQFSIGYNY